MPSPLLDVYYFKINSLNGSLEFTSTRVNMLWCLLSFLFGTPYCSDHSNDEAFEEMTVFKFLVTRSIRLRPWEKEANSF